MKLICLSLSPEDMFSFYETAYDQVDEYRLEFMYKLMDDIRSYLMDYYPDVNWQSAFPPFINSAD